MKIRHVHNSIIPKILRVGAITIYPFIFYAMKEPDEKLVRHEMVHVKQVELYGWVGFYASYLCYYWAHRWMGYNHDQAYRNIPHEVQAYQLQEEEGEIELT